FGTDKLSEDDLPKLEAAMRKHLPEWTGFTHEEVSKDEAAKRFSGASGNNEYKGELIQEITERGEKITLYTCGGFTDLCRGGHAENPAKEIAPDSFKLDRIAGAYWRGDEKNPMLTRIYGLAFDTKAELDAYLLQREEAAKRDHRKLGAELKIFTLSPLVGSGLPLLQPNGAIIRREIEEYLWSLHKDKGYHRVWTPHLAKEALYQTSGHASKFGDELFRVSGKDEQFFMKPMNCPHHMQIFADNQFSYRDMPVRYFEPATVYRDEKTGQLGGLTRVRSITQDDGHLFCRVSQIGQEVSTIVGVIKEFYKTMNMLDGYWVRLSVRGPEGMYLGSDEVWAAAEGALEEAAQHNGLPYKRVEGEAAFYGPKLDFMFKDAIGREWQLATIQCDFNLPERFDLSFINEKGERERPVVIHRAISGSLERFMGVMIEHFAGAFPTWLSPVQAVVLPISDKHADYAHDVCETMRAAGIRTDLDDSSESLGKKIRSAKQKKVPYTLVIGDAEVAANQATLESRDHGKIGTLAID
ncbi:MAG TPA: threonine--tRNA ligase, partial [Candidatus Paceibacterota bacterium]